MSSFSRCPACCTEHRLSLKHSYTLAAPVYDLFLDSATRRARSRSLAPLHAMPPAEVLLLGVGTGLDLPHLSSRHVYTGLDLTAAMLERTRPRAAKLDFRPVRGDAQQLPFQAERFDVVVMHLILAVVPSPERCFAEALRVLRAGGELLVFDKFLKPGEGGWKRALTPLTRRVATRLDVVFEDLAALTPGIEIASDEPALAAGWFRLIRVRKLC